MHKQSHGIKGNAGSSRQNYNEIPTSITRNVPHSITCQKTVVRFCTMKYIHKGRQRHNL